MFFLLLSPQRALVQGQNRTGRLYSSGTRSRKRRRVRWHFCWLHRLVPGTFLVQARTYSDLREPHFSKSPQSCAAFRHWFSPSSCTRDEAVGSGWNNTNVCKSKITFELCLIFSITGDRNTRHWRHGFGEYSKYNLIIFSVFYMKMSLKLPALKGAIWVSIDVSS